jgi:cyclase
MNSTRVIPVILLSKSGMVKTVKFKTPIYIGDPINAVRIFNEKEVDEIIVLDIDATRFMIGPNFKKIEEIASEAFMPLAYGGGIQSINQIEKLFKIGVEKVVINSAIYGDSKLLTEASKIFGSQSIVASIDVKKDFFGNYHLYSNAGAKKEKIDLLSCIERVQDEGAGEVIINSIDQDGTMAGYDLVLIGKISHKFKVPFVVIGGAGAVDHLRLAINAGASAVAAGSMFVFHGRHKAVLISYVSGDKINFINNLEN